MLHPASAHVQALQLDGKLGVTRLKRSLADRSKQQNLEKFTGELAQRRDEAYVAYRRGVTLLQ
jgi:hypothetical protein